MIGHVNSPTLPRNAIVVVRKFGASAPPQRRYADAGRDAVAGAISAVVQIAYCISFAALIFTGDLAGGFSLGLAGLIMGAVVTCIVIAVTSTFSPVVGGPDSPAVAVMSVLASSIAAALQAKGASTDAIILNVLVALTVSTLLTGILLYGTGALKLGQWLRFIPYPVIGGFLAASGILLLTGGMEVITQTNLTLQPSSWEVLYSSTYGPQIIIGALFAISIPILGRFVPAYLALPLAFFGFLIALDGSLFGLVKTRQSAGPGSCRASGSSVSGSPSMPSCMSKSIGASSPRAARRSARFAA